MDINIDIPCPICPTVNFIDLTGKITRKEVVCSGCGDSFFVIVNLSASVTVFTLEKKDGYKVRFD